MSVYIYPNIPDSLNIGDKIRFNCTKTVQEFDVTKYSKLEIECCGAGGYSSSRYRGGYGNKVSGVLSISKYNIPKLYVIVGGEGTVANVNNKPMGGGYNGGGNGKNNGESNTVVGGGGGATDIRIEYSNDIFSEASLKSRIIVGSGGGGATDNTDCIGGNGGFTTGQKGGGTPSESGNGATQTSGGTVNGSFGEGGNATGFQTPWNGGGGGGWFGGGTSSEHRAGGGGSSYIAGHPSCTLKYTNVEFESYVTQEYAQSTNANDGYCIITILELSNTIKANCKIDGTIREVDKMSVKIDNTWKEVEGVFVKIGNEWKSNE